MFKQRIMRNANKIVVNNNSSELKQCSERSMISQFNSSGLKRRSEHSHKKYFSMTCVRTA